MPQFGRSLRTLKTPSIRENVDRDPYEQWHTNSEDQEWPIVRFALIGCGKIGKVHADSIAAHPRAELAWACHPRKQAADKFAQRVRCQSEHGHRRCTR